MVLYNSEIATQMNYFWMHVDSQVMCLFSLLSEKRNTGNQSKQTTAGRSERKLVLLKSRNILNLLPFIKSNICVNFFLFCLVQLRSVSLVHMDFTWSEKAWPFFPIYKALQEQLVVFLFNVTLQLFSEQIQSQ